jgi:hypothetical protein
MSVERTNTKINLEGSQPISDYERKIRSIGIVQKVYRKELQDYVINNVEDPIVKERVLAEIAKYPCQAINQMAKRIDQLILKIESKTNKERNKIEEIIKLPDTQQNNLDIGDLYDSISNVNEIENIENNSDLVSENEEDSENAENI